MPERALSLVPELGLPELPPLYMDMTPEEWNHVMQVNVTAAMFLAQKCIPQMLKQGGGKIVFTEMDNQSIPYDGPLTGKVDVAVRPENLQIDPAGALSGRLETKYYLGDVSDFRVRSGSEQVRVIAPGAAFPDLAEGQEVRFSIREFLVYEDDGSLEEMLQIRS